MKKNTLHHESRVRKNIRGEGATYLAHPITYQNKHKKGWRNTKNTPRGGSRICITVSEQIDTAARSTKSAPKSRIHGPTLSKYGINITGTNIIDSLRWTLREQNYTPRNKDNYIGPKRATYLAQERLRRKKNWRRINKERKQRNRQGMTKRNKRRTRYFFYPGRGKPK